MWDLAIMARFRNVTLFHPSAISGRQKLSWEKQVGWNNKENGASLQKRPCAEKFHRSKERWLMCTHQTYHCGADKGHCCDDCGVLFRTGVLGPLCKA